MGNVSAIDRLSWNLTSLSERRALGIRLGAGLLSPCQPHKVSPHPLGQRQVPFEYFEQC